MTLPTSTAASSREAARHNDGRFGVQPLAEAPVSLADFDFDDPEQANDMIQRAKRMSSKWSRSRGSADRGYDVDDVAQDAVLAILERRAKGGSIDNVYAYLNSSSASAAANAGRSVRAEDYAAYRLFQSIRGERISELGRDLNSTEEAALAAEVRADWHDPRHRPSPEFLMNVKGREVAMTRLATGSIEGADLTTDERFDHLVARSGVAADDSDLDVRPGSYMDRALDAAEGFDGAGGRAQSRRLLWNAFAERCGAPLVDQPHLGHRATTAARNTIPAETDVAALVADWEDERTTTAQEEALFAPWPDTDVRQRADIANLLTRNPGSAYGMWDSAMKLASRPRGTSRQSGAES